MVMKRNVRNFIFVFLGVIILGGTLLVTYALFFFKDPVELFKNNLNNMYKELANSFDNQPLVEFSKYEMYGRFKISDNSYDYPVDFIYDFGIKSDREKNYLDVEYTYLNDENEKLYRYYEYLRDNESYLMYPDITEKVIEMNGFYSNEEDNSVVNPISLEFLVVAKYWLYEIECIKNNVLEIVVDKDIQDERVTIKIDNVEVNAKKIFYKMDKKQSTLFREKVYNDIIRNNDYIVYLMDLNGESREEVLASFSSEVELLGSEIAIYLDEKDNFLKFESITNNQVDSVIEKRGDNFYFESRNEDNDNAKLEFGDKYYRIESSAFVEGDIVNFIFEIVYDSITTNRAAGDMNISFTSTNKNESYNTTMVGNFTYNSKDFFLKEIIHEETYDVTDLTDAEINDFNYFFNSMGSNENQTT